MYKYTFWRNSVKGLNEDISLMARNYKHALKEVTSYINTKMLPSVRGK